jgi:hypothetical protein
MVDESTPATTSGKSSSDLQISPSLSRAKAVKSVLSKRKLRAQFALASRRLRNLVPYRK